MGSKKKATVGYRYYVGAHLVLAHGPVDAVVRLRVGERDAWTGSSTGGRINVNAPELFGGEKREGGVVGAVDVLMGADTQTPNDYLVAQLPGPTPAFRGVLSLVLRGVYVAAMNPYLKPWAVEARRIPKSFYPERAAIGVDANPAHILHEVLTNDRWGMGLAAGEIDEPSFRAAADTLSTEGFGLSLLWAQAEPVEEFVRSIVRTCDASLYVAPATGLFTLKLIRDNYSLATLPRLNPANVIELERLGASEPAELVNQLTVIYDDREAGREAQVTVQDLASIEAQGATIAAERRHPGIPTAALAARVATRELRALATPLARATLVTNRAGAALAVGDPVVLDWPPLGLADLVMRVADAAYGEPGDARVRLELVQDVFGLPQAVVTAPAASGWQNPIRAPAPAPYRRAVELPYWVIARELAGDNDTLLSGLDASSAYLGVLAARPSSDAINWELQTRTGANAFVARDTEDFAPHATLSLACGPADTTLTITPGDDLGLAAPGGYAYLGEEVVAVRQVTTTAVVCDRGVLDTTPAAWAAGTRLWFAEGFQAVDPTEWTSGVTVEARALPTTGRGTLAEADAPTNALTLTGRAARPYPPGRVRINGAAWPAAVVGDVVLAWAGRDRTQQTAYLVTQDETAIGPEAGVTTTVRIYRAADGALLRTLAGITASTLTYSRTQEDADNGGGPVPRLRITLTAVRDGLESWQPQLREVDRAGWGLHWGNYYGGV